MAPGIEPFFHAPTGTWTYVVHDAGDAVVIDPVLDYDPASGRVATDSAAAVLAFIAGRDLQVRRILETHAHADHLTAAAFLRAKTGAPVAIGAGIRAVQANFAPVFGWAVDDPALAGAFDALLEDGQAFEAGALRIEAMALPGHTADSLGYRIGRNVFVGDTLFAPDVGTARCDFPGGDARRLHASIERLHALPADTVFWLCHDYPPAGRERRPSVGAGESAERNRMLPRGLPVEAFVAARQARDAALPPPQLLYPALQVNIRGGRLPPPDADGRRFLRTPLRIEGDASGLA
jgi:glyoxylase-like metal-dependent hydrolase (beta-lactamase superfamily II)